MAPGSPSAGAAVHGPEPCAGAPARACLTGAALTARGSLRPGSRRDRAGSDPGAPGAGPCVTCAFTCGTNYPAPREFLSGAHRPSARGDKTLTWSRLRLAGPLRLRTRTEDPEENWGAPVRDAGPPALLPASPPAPIFPSTGCRPGLTPGHQTGSDSFALHSPTAGPLRGEVPMETRGGSWRLRQRARHSGKCSFRTAPGWPRGTNARWRPSVAGGSESPGLRALAPRA